MRHPARQPGAPLFARALVVLGLLISAVAQAAIQDITSQFTITRSGLLLNRASNTFDSTTTLKNTNPSAVYPPVVVAVNILPASVILANKAGQTADGRPYVIPALSGGSLASGGTVSFVLKFVNPQRVPFTSTLQIFNGINLPPDAPSLIGVVATGGTNALLVGRVVGASNLPLTLQAYSSATCVDGSLVGGAAVGAAPVTTDAAGYFAVSVAGVNPGSFVAVNVISPTVTATSTCLVNSRDNDSWPKAFTLAGSSVSVTDLIDAPGKARWYNFNILPGQRIGIDLSGLPADYNLAVFKDIGQAFNAQFNPGTAGVADLLKLTAEFAPSAFSPSAFSPSAFSPSAFSPSAFSPSAFSANVFSPSAFSPSAFSPSAFSPSVFTTTEIAQAFSTAQTRSIISIAATPGTSDKSTVVNTWNNTGNFYVRVAGHGNAFDTTTPFTLSVSIGATTCVNVSDMTLKPRAVQAATGLQTILLTDSSDVALDAPLSIPGGGTLRDRLAALAKRSEIAGLVVDVATDARVQALKLQAENNPACPFAKNLVAQEIKGIVDSYRSNPLRYVVIVGDDDAIPFFRSPDQSSLGEESGYFPPVESNSPSEASLRLDYVLSQDAYGSNSSISLRIDDFPVPGLAVGRLVKTADEIGGVIDAYVASNGFVSPSSSLVTGYDFLATAAQAVQTEFQLGTGSTPDSLITPNGKSPQDPASWTATQLGQKLFGGRHDVIFLAGHFSANSALAADFSTSLLTTDLAASTVNFTNSIVFSAGCHSGYDIVDADAIAGVTQTLDWTQAFARKGATLVAGTGYQYGDTDFLEYSGLIYANFARQLRAGTGAISVGEALVRAKLDYLAITPDIRGIPEKALLEATLYGLPMLGVNMPSGRGAVPGTGAAITPVAIASGPAASLGLKSYDLSLAPSLTANSVGLKNTQGGADVMATWLSGPDGVITNPLEPVLPLIAVNVTPTDPKVVLRGVGFRGGSYADVSPILPFSGAPTTELRGVHVPFLSPTFYPAQMWTPNYFGALAGSGGTQLLVTPAQHRVASVTDGTSTRRAYSGLNLRLYYSGNLSQAALSEAPTIVEADAQPDAGGVTFSAQVVGDPAAGIEQVWVTYTSDGVGTWTSLDLNQCVAPLPSVCGTTEDSRVWKGHLSSAPVNLMYVVQAVNGVGLVSLEDNRGAYFGVVGAPPTPTTFALDPPPSSASFGDTIDITGVLTSGGVPVPGKIVTITVGGTTQIGMTDSNGRVAVTVPAVAVTGNFQVTAAFAGDNGLVESSASGPITVGKAASSLSALAPVGATLTGTNGSQTLPLQQESVGFAVSGPGGARTIFAITNYLGQATLPPPGLPAGSYTVTQASYIGNSTYAASSVALAQQFTVAQTAQSITFGALGDKTLGDPDFAVYATASSTLPVSFAASGMCTVTGNTVHLSGAGSCTITASQAGDADYSAALPVAQTFAVAHNMKADQVISFGTAPSGVNFGDPPLTVSATSASPTAPPSSIPILFSSLTPSVCTTGGANGATVTLVAPGQCTIAANQAGDANYNPAPQVTLMFTVGTGTTAHFGVTGSMLNARSDHTSTLLDDGRVLVAGGFDASGAPLATAELYCPDNATAPPSFVVCPLAQRGNFSATPATLSVAAAGQTATRLHDGIVLLIGGNNGYLQSFNPSDGTWTASSALPLADRTFHTATLLSTGEVFVAGGVNSLGVTLSSTFILDPETVPWTITQGPDLLFARESHTATLLPDDTVLFAGGRRRLSPSGFALVGEFELYDPNVAGPSGNGEVVDESAMSRARFWHAAEIVGQSVVIAGGSCDTASSVSSSLTSTEFFGFTTGAQPPVACAAPGGSSDLLQARRAFTMTVLQDGSLLAVGGADGSSLQRNSSEIFVSSSNTFQPGPSLTNARSEHEATLLLDGRVLVTGGVGMSGTAISSAEVFSGANGTGTSNRPPVANAGSDQTVTAGDTVQLTSAGSSDPQAAPLSYYWSFTSKPAGSTAHFSNSNAANPTFVADKQGLYGVELIVSDNSIPPLDSAPATVHITANNAVPVANPDAYTVAQGATLTVNAANGVLANDTDVDGDPLTAILVATVAHGLLTLNANGSFTYTPNAAYNGPDSFTYHASDGIANSNIATVSLTVTPVNTPPVASAGPDQSAMVGQLVQLSGSCTDPDGDVTTPSWSFNSKPATSNAALSSTSVLNPTFTPDLAGSYVLQLVCNDGTFNSAPSMVTITASGGTISLSLLNTGVVGVGRSAVVSITLSTPAPAGGLGVTLSSDDTSVLGVTTATVTVAAAQTQATGTISGVATGNTTLRASAGGFTPAALSINVTASIVTVATVNVALESSAPLPISISVPAPAGGLPITLTSNDTSVVTLGVASITIPAGQTTGSATVNGVGIGSTTVLAQAPGYASGLGTVTTSVPSTLMVSNLNDSGAGSLRDAIAQANLSPGTTIVFAPGLTGTILLTSGQIQITDSLSLVGPGADQLTIDGNANDRIFAITESNASTCPTAPSDYLVSISGLTLTNAHRNTDNAGGAIQADHSLALVSVTISNSIAKIGGGVRFHVQYPGQTLTIIDSQFINNIAQPLSATVSSTSDDGGALDISEKCASRTSPVTVTIANSVFSGNHAQPVALSASGGAISTFSYADITITDSRIVGNHVDVPNPPVANQSYSGGGIFGTAKSLKLERTEVSDNSTNDVTLSDQTRGGGLGLYNDAADLQAPASAMAVNIVNSTISGNSVGYFGGALWVAGNVAVELDNSTVSNNAAPAGATGGIQLTTRATNPPSASNATAPTFKLVSSILAKSSAASDDVGTNTTVIPSFTINATTSLIETICSTCNITVSGSGNLIAVDPQLGALAFNGGPSRTQALLGGSPAIDAGSNPLNLTTDQRGPGFPRVVGAAADMGAYEAANTITLTVASPLTGVTQTVGGTITLGTAAPAGGLTVTLVSATPGVATVAPSSVIIPAGTTTGSFTITGVASGTSLLTASATGYTNGTLTVTVTDNVISIGSITLGPGASGNVPVTLSQPAPAGGLVVNLASSNAAILSFASPTVTIPAGSTIAPSNPVVNASSTTLGTVTLTASAANYVSGTGTGRVVLTATLAPNPLNTFVGRTDPMTVGLSQPALAGGVTVNLTSSNTAVATVPAQVTVPQGNVSVQFGVTGVSAGNGVTITASGALVTTGTATVNVAPAPSMTYTYANYALAKDSQESGFSISLSAPAPAGGVVVTLTSSDPTRLLLAPNGSTAAGTASLNITVPAGQSSLAYSLQALQNNGSPTITVSAPGYTGTSGTHPLTPSGFFINSPGSFSTTTLSPDTPIDVCFVKLDAALNNNGYRTLRPGVTPVSLSMSSDNASAGTITGSPRTMTGGQTCSNASGGDFGFHVAGSGMATLSLATPAGYSTPANLTQSIIATVTTPTLTYNYPNYALGKDSQENGFTISLGAPAPAAGVVVTLTSSDPTRLLLATNVSTAVGTTTLNITVPAGQSSLAYSLQALQDNGSATITASAPGFVGTSGTHPLTPSGFFINSPGSFSTTTLSPDTPIDVCFVKLDAALNNNGYRVLRPGVAPVSLSMSSDNASAGTITGSPRTVTAGQTCSNASGGDFGFHVTGSGMAHLSLTTPAGYSTPANLNQSITATVTSPTLTYNYPNYALAKDSQENGFSISLGAPAPAAGLVVTLTSSDPTRLLLAPNGSAAVGTSTLNITVPAGQSSLAYSLQALQDNGSATITVSAPGYTGTSGTHPLTPSGFFINSPGSFSTTTLSPDTPIDVCFVKLDASLNNNGYRVLRPGVTPVSLSMSSNNMSVGTITGSPRTMIAGQTCSNASGGDFGFHVAGSGMATLSLATPPGYSTPANLNQSIVATVGVPAITFTYTNYALGKDSQENGFSISLSAPAPAGGVTVTLTSLDPTRLLFATNGSTSIGSATLNLNIPAAQSAAAYSLQALADNGDVGVTATATGYTSAGTSHPLTPSGFFINSPGNFTTTTGSADTAIDVCFVKLDASLNNNGYRVLRPGVTPVSLTMSSNTMSVGTITGSPRTMTGGQQCSNASGGDFGFHAAGSGMATLSLTTPAGYSTPANLTESITATVN